MINDDDSSRSTTASVTNEHSITQWIDQIREGDSVAPAELWNRYSHRLVGLARKKLKDAPRRVADEEDVVIEAFNSFCRGAEAGRFPKLDDRDDLWQVLVMLTARKAANQLKHDTKEARERIWGHPKGSGKDLEKIWKGSVRICEDL